MNAVSTWKKHENALRQAVADRPAPRSALPEYLRVLDEVRAETMAAQPDEFLRQQAGVLFEQARTGALLLETVAAEENARPARRESAAPGIAGTAAAFLACAAALLRGQWLIAALALAAGLCALLPLMRGRGGEAPGAPREIVRAERLAVCGEQMMQRIDGSLLDLGALNRQIAGQAGGGADMKALSLCQELWESRGEGPDADNAVTDQCIDHLLRQSGCEFAMYDAAHARAFSTLPSRSTNRTIRPAVVERGTGRLLLRGLAAVREEGS